MDNIFGGGAIGLYLFLYLLPGLFGALVYEFTLDGEKRELMDRVATALVLVLALVSNLALHFLFGERVVPNIEIKSDTPANVILDALLQPTHLLLATLISSAVALGFAVAMNHGWIYAAMRTLKLNRKTGETDVWQQMFTLYFDHWIALELEDGRQLVAWPMRSSSSGRDRALLLGDATWYVTDAERTATAKNVRGPGVYVANFSEIVSIEVLD
ncbi:MAG: DUF6338 family protein [Roseiarcus sp.]